MEEYARLEAAAAALDGATGTATVRRGPERPAAARPPRRRAAGHASTTGSGRGRPRGTGTRAKQALALVTASPGITIPQLAEQMGIKQNYLYRVLPGLAQDGLVEKDGQGWHPKTAA